MKNKIFLLLTIATSLVYGAPPAIGGYNVYYGHLHNHSNVGGANHAVGTPDDAYNYAKNTAHLDFFSLADHDLYISPTDWAAIKTAADRYNQDNVFTTFRGFEWTTSDLGHIAIINSDDYCTFSGSSTNTFLKACSWISARNNCVAFFNHPGRQNATGREFDHFNAPVISNMVGMELWNKSDPFSVYYYNNGYYNNDKNKGYFDEALKYGWKIGAGGSEDNHEGTWGTKTNFRMAVLATALTRTDILTAIQARRYFSTLDKNMALSFKIDNMEMGSTVTSGSSIIQIQASDGDGENFNKIMLFNKNHDTVNTWNINTPSVNVSYAVTTTDSNYFYVKISQVDGDEAISSPIWIIPNKPPSSTMTSPINGAIFTAPALVSIAANAADADGTISKVAFYSNGGMLFEDVSAPYSYNWTNVAAGTYALTAVATDNRGAIATSSSISITVNALPTCDITAPAGAAMFTAPALVSIAANAADADGTISKVVFYSNGGMLFEDVSAPYSYNWTNVAAGTYALTAVATDNRGAIATSSSISITVNALPTCDITAPAGAATFTAPATVSIAATAADADGTISKVVFYSNGGMLFEDVSAPYSYNWANVAAGAYALNAVATDNRGGVATSSTISITVNVPPNQSPTCTISEPLNNATFTAPATVSIAAHAADADGTISKVAFYSNGGMLFEDVSAPYGYNWTNVAAGTYVITAVATDNLGAVATSLPISITINTPINQPPTCSITTPTANAIFTAPATVSIAANAADDDGTISKVVFYSNAGMLFEDVSAPYGYDWTSVPPGVYLITAVATDNLGTTTTSSPISITINAPPNLLPSCSITGPVSGATFTAPATVTMTANASDPDGSINKVGFYCNGGLLFEDAVEPYAYDWTSVPNGSYAITVVATDNVGAIATSSPISITINAPPNQPPTCNITAPAANAIFTAPATISLAANAADADGSISKVAFYGNGTLLFEDVEAPYLYNWTNVANGPYIIAAIATDNTGVQTTSAIISITVNPLNQPATCAITAPPNGAAFIAPASVTISANATYANGSISKVAFYSNGGLLFEDASTPYSYDWTSVGTGTFTITAVATDNTGAQANSSPISITVKAPNQPPACNITAPAGGATFIAPASISIAAHAADADGTVNTVAFYSNGSLLFEDASAPFAYDWNNVAPGSYVITSIATDNVGAVTTSSPISITVNAPNLPPTCSITAPAGGATFIAPASISITAHAADTDGAVNTVAFYSNGSLLFEDAHAPFVYNWTNVAPGSYAITAIAMDNAGAVTTSSPISIAVNIPLPPALISPLLNASDVSLFPIFTWNQAINAQSYGAQLSTDSSFASTLIDTTLGDTSFSTSRSLSEHLKYFWRARVFNSACTSAWSEPEHFTTLQPVPNQVTLLAPLDCATLAFDSAFFIWSKPSPIIDRYSLEIATDSSMTHIVKNDTSLTDTIISQVKFSNKKSYWWRVKAHNISGWGPYSKIREITITLPSTAVLPASYLQFSNGTSSSMSMISYGLPNASNVSVRLYSIQGKLVQTVFNSFQKKGLYKMPISFAGLSKGCYLINFKTDTVSKKWKVSIPF
jgi:hypothetical protein